MKATLHLICILSHVALGVAMALVPQGDRYARRLASIPYLLMASSKKLCNTCSNDAALCCPVACGPDGHCPRGAVLNAGFTIGGENIVD